MKYKIDNTKGKRCKIEFRLDDAEWADALEKAYLKERGKYKIQGFRKGHAPRGIIEKNYGPAVFMEEAINIVFPSVYKQVLDENVDLHPVEVPELDLVEVVPQVVFNAEFDLLPEVVLGKVKGNKIVKATLEVTDKEVDDEIAKAQDKVSRKVEVQRNVQQGDFVVIDFAGSIDGIAFDGGSATDFELEIGSGQFIPGFEDQLIGLDVGQSRDVKVPFPQDYHAKDLAGKDAVFAVKLSSIKANQKPELNDDFAKDVSVFDTFTEYREDVKRKLEESTAKKAQTTDDNKLLEVIVEQTTVDIPQSMIERQIDSMIDEFGNMMQRRGIGLDKYLEITNTNQKDLRETYKKEATLAVKVRLTVDQMIKQQNFDIDESEIDSKMQTVAEQNQMTVDQIKQAIEDKMISMDEIRHSIKLDKLQKFLRDNNEFVTEAN